MALCEMRLTKVPSINRMSSFMAILPIEGAGPFPVLYLLHGYSDDYTGWSRRSMVELHVEDVPIIVIMPDGERSFYTNSKSDPTLAFEDYITRDLVGFVDRIFPTIPERRGRAIAGLSMGGYGAMSLALKHPDLYCASVAMSGALKIGSNDWSKGEEPWAGEMTRLFGSNPAGGRDDILALLEKSDPNTRPALRVDCGTEDFLYNDNVAVHECMVKLGIEHEYNKRPGEHNWDYWDKAFIDALPFLKRNLGIEET